FVSHASMSGASLSGTAIVHPYARAIAALPPIWSEWQCVLTSFVSGAPSSPWREAMSASVSGTCLMYPESMTTLPSRPRSSTLFDDSQSRTKTCSCLGNLGAVTVRAAGPRPPWTCDEHRCNESRPRVPTRIGRRSPRRGAPRRLLASLPLRAKYSPSGGRRHSVAAELANEAASVGVQSFQPCQKVANEGDALLEGRCRLIDANAIRSGKTDAPVALHQQNQFARINRRRLHELQRRALGTCIDLDDALFPGEQTQSVTREQRLHRLGRRTEPVDQLFAHQIELIRRIDAREPFIEHETLVHVAAISFGQPRRRMQVDLGRDTERLRQIRLSTCF